MKPERDSQLATLADVARLAGVNKSTASRALRNRQHVREATRRKVAAAAEALGYQPDPSLARLAARRWRQETGAPRELVAFVAPERDPSAEQLAAHCQRAGARFGVSVAPYFLEDYVSGRSLAKSLEYRGVRKLIVHGFTRPESLGDFCLSRYVAVSCGAFLQMRLCSVVLNWEWMLAEANRRLRSLDFCRIGLLLDGATPLEAKLAKAAFAQSAAGAVADRLRPEGLASWFSQYKPEAIVGFGADGLECMRRAGLRAPEDCGYLSLTAGGGGEGQIAGFEPGGLLLAEKALLALHRPQLLGGERTDRMELCQLAPEWREGRSLRVPRISESLAVSA